MARDTGLLERGCICWGPDAKAREEMGRAGLGRGQLKTSGRAMILGPGEGEV